MNRCLFALVLASCAAVGCNTPEYRVPYTQAVTELKAMYPVPTSDDPEYRKALAKSYPAYSPEALEVPGFPIQWDLVVTEGETTPNMEYHVNILKNWKLMAARRTNITVQAVGASAVRVHVTSERQMGGDVWARDPGYEMQRRNEIEKRFKALAAAPAAPAQPAQAAAPRGLAPIGKKAAAPGPRPVPVTPAEQSRRPVPAPGGRGAAEPPMAPPPGGGSNDEPQTIP